MTMISALETSQTISKLVDGEVYPDLPSKVELKETHMSWVFLTDRYAYKLRKPLRYNSQDFRTLKARLEDARLEIELNRRLADDLYLGIVPVTYSLQDGVLVEGKGSVVEWMVKMRRLPDNRMMDYLIRSSKLSLADIHAVSTHLARFYKNCAHVEMKESEYISKLMSEIHNNHDTLSIADYSFAQEQLEYLYRMLCTFVCNFADLFRLRIQKGCIVDGHGDLRPEHVCIESVHHVTIFDCLQFSRELRIVDCVDEISFLALECERMGAPGTGYEILKTYFETTGDYPPDALINFYKAYRASMWARLALYRTKELPQYHWGKWLEKAHKYIDLAEKCARHLPIHAC